ncbi:MAG: SRPBCC family protein, partial [Pseudomonadota bacterium]
NAKLLVCPYHAWTYELTGELRSGPNVRAVPGFDRTKICLTSVRIENFNGFLFANLDPDAKPMDEWFPNARKELAAWVPEIDKLKPLEWVEIPENCNWKVSVENYSECYHCSLNHQTFSTGVVKPETYDIQPEGYILRHRTECQNLESMTYPIDLESNEYAGQYSSWFLWPMFSFQVYPGNVLNTYHWRAIDAGHVVVWRGWYTVDGVKSDVISDLAIQDRQTTVEEDIHLVESVQRGLNSRGYVPGPLVLDPKCGVSSEHSIKALQQWMREAVDA